MYYTYVLQSSVDPHWYTGCTADLRKRLNQHNSGQVSSTSLRRPLTLVYYEACLHRYDAFRRERFLKTGKGKRYLRRRMMSFLAPTNQRRLERP